MQKRHNSPLPAGLLTALTAMLLVSCTDPPVNEDVFQDAVTTDEKDPDPDIHEYQPVVVDEDFRIIHSSTATDGTRPGEIVIADPRAGEGTPGNPAWESNFALASGPLSLLGLDCTIGCFFGPTLRNIAVATSADEGTPGLDIEFVRFDDSMNATLIPGVTVKSVRHAVMSGDVLYVSRFRNDCETSNGNTKTCYLFGRIDLTAEQPTIQELFEFPTTDLLSESNFSGRFRLGADGSTIVMQNLEKESLQFFLFDTENGLRNAGGRVCQATGLDGECMYSQDAPVLTDDIPAILTADGSTIVFVHVNDGRDLRITAMDTQTGQTGFTTLVSTPGRYRTNACYNLRGPFRYTDIWQPLLLSTDGSEVIFTAASDCDVSIGKTWTNIMAVKLSRIGSGEMAGEDFLRAITDFPQAGIPELISISPGTMSLSPSGRFLSFSGTASRDSSGQPLTAATQQHFIDREAYVTSTTKVTRPIQVSGNLFYRAAATVCSTTSPWFAAVTDPVPEEDL